MGMLSRDREEGFDATLGRVANYIRAPYDDRPPQKGSALCGDGHPGRGHAVSPTGMNQQSSRPPQKTTSACTAKRNGTCPIPSDR